MTVHRLPENQSQSVRHAWRKQLATLGLFASVALGLSACGSNPVIVMQITTTPDPRVIPITITNTNAANPVQAVTVAATTIPVTPLSVAATVIPVTAASPEAQPSAAQPGPDQTTVAQATGLQPAQVAGTAAPTSANPVTPTASGPVPTETHIQVSIAHENFQHGYMFWISTENQIWVLEAAANAPASSITPPTNGTWMIFPDTYVNGEQEVDPAMVPPSALLFQPRRGFGKLWRTNDQVRNSLGWATTQEFGLTTSYVYQPGGNVDPATGKWVPGPGTHLLVTISRETFAFHEPAAGQQFGTWEKVG